MAQELTVCASSTRGLDSILGQGTRPHMLQLRVGMWQGRLKISRASTKSWQGQKKTKNNPYKPPGSLPHLLSPPAVPLLCGQDS